MAEDDGPDRIGNLHHREGRAQRHAGDDPRQRDGQEDKERDLFPPEEPRPRHRGGDQRAEDDGKHRRHRRDLERQDQRRPDVRPVPGDAEPFQRQARRRELVALFLGGEGVEEDEKDRQVQEEKPRDGGDPEAEGGAVRAHRRPPCVSRC